jgi:hypothetical protein
MVSGSFAMIPTAAVLFFTAWPAATEPQYAGIRIVDGATGRGVPLVELTTVNQLKFVTDNAGYIALREPELMDCEVFFHVFSHGYEMKKDGFGFAGAKVKLKAGKVHEIKITRKNIAERLCRLTGEGLYRDSELLGLKVPPRPNGKVFGQDSIQSIVYKGNVYWFWGDTNRGEYPLGMFRMAGAKTPLPGKDFDIGKGIAYDYFTEPSGFVRPMMPLKERPEGVVWIDGLCVVPDDKGLETIVAHYSRRKGLADELEHGIARWDDDSATFQPILQLPLAEKWRHPHGHPIIHEFDGKKWLLSGNPGLNVRVPATLPAILDAKQYEALTVEKNMWAWQSTSPPTGSEQEAKRIKVGTLAVEHTRFLPANAADPKERVQLHNGSVRWNAHRKKWVLLAGQYGAKSSLLGEVWYSEADDPTGPFAKAVKVVTHDRMTFYNVCQHDFLDAGGGRFIHFEGTYTADFSGNPIKTPRYDYNQVMYRLDLDAIPRK